MPAARAAAGGTRQVSFAWRACMVCAIVWSACRAVAARRGTRRGLPEPLCLLHCRMEAQRRNTAEARKLYLRALQVSPAGSGATGNVCCGMHVHAAGVRCRLALLPSPCPCSCPCLPQVDPQHGQSILGLGQLEARAGNSGAALQLYRQGLAAQPGSTFLLASLAQLQTQVGRWLLVGLAPPACRALQWDGTTLHPTASAACLHLPPTPASSDEGFGGSTADVAARGGSGALQWPRLLRAGRAGAAGGALGRRGCLVPPRL